MRVLRVCAVSFLLCAAVANGQTPERQLRPNVVLIMMDDMGYGDLGSYGAQDVKTPNIDRLAKHGVRFTESYANAAVCSPTRAALITGQYQQRVGLEWALGSAGVELTKGLRATGASLPALLKKSGYSTGLVGKWHLGVTPETGPNAHGFDEFFGFLGGAVDYYTHQGMDGKSDLFENRTPVQTPRYLTDEITSRSVGFIERHAAAPFFLEVAYNATHWPFQPPDQPPTAEARKVHPNLYETPGEPGAHTRQDYLRILERADQGVGEIMGALEKRGLTQNTLVIFTNDNGGEWLSRNAPFFNQKSTLWEGGIRVPLIMQWPGRLPVGTTSRQVAMTMDVTASVLAATGTPAAADYPLDGINLLPIARGDAPLVVRDVFWRIKQPTRVQIAVRSGSWKLLVEGNSVQDGVHVMLFDLSADQGERHDAVSEYPARVADLRARIAAWEKQVAPTPAPVQEIRTYIDVVVSNAKLNAVVDQVKAAFLAEHIPIAGSSTETLVMSDPIVGNPAARFPYTQVYRVDVTGTAKGDVSVRFSGTGQNGTASANPLTSEYFTPNSNPNGGGWALLERLAARLRGMRTPDGGGVLPPPSQRRKKAG